MKSKREILSACLVFLSFFLVTSCEDDIVLEEGLPGRWLWVEDCYEQECWEPYRFITCDTIDSIINCDTTFSDRATVLRIDSDLSGKIESYVSGDINSYYSSTTFEVTLPDDSIRFNPTSILIIGEGVDEKLMNICLQNKLNGKLDVFDKDKLQFGGFKFDKVK